MLKFSLILPVYNVAKFLPDCFASLYCQNLPESEYEIICVDDGSADDSAKVITEYQKTHVNLRLLRQANFGVCVARNRGLEIAQGEYVWFIDPDDMISAGCLPKIYDSMRTHRADVFEICHYRTCEENQKFSPDAIDFTVEGEGHWGAGGSSWLLICRRGYLLQNHISFDPRFHYGEDYLWVLQVKYRRHHNIYTNTPLYIYRQRAGSAMHSATFEKTRKHMDDMLLLCDVYDREYERCQGEHLGEAILSNLKKRRQLCMETALFYLLKLKLPGEEVKATLQKWRQKGYYPYRLMFWNLGITSVLGSWSLRGFKFLFPWQWYFLAMCAIYRKRGK